MPNLTLPDNQTLTLYSTNNASALTLRMDATASAIVIEDLSLNTVAKLAAATTTVAGFMSAADKTKLDGIDPNAQAYTHPETHPASIIVQDSSNRFVTDEQISSWNSKAAGTHSHAATDITQTSGYRFVTDTEKSTWNAKQSALNYTPVNKAGDTMSGDLSAGSYSFKLNYVGSTPASGPAIKWTDGTLTNTLGLFLTGGLNIQGNSGNPDIIFRAFTTDGTLGTETLRVLGSGNDAILKIGRITGKPSIKSTDSWLILDSNAGTLGLNHYVTDNIELVGGGGKVGIGTQDPGVKLHIVGTGSMLRLENTATTGDNHAQMHFKAGNINNYIWTNNDTYTGYGGIGSLNLYTGAVSPIAFHTYATERMRIAGDGTIGIGTTTPNFKLDISGDTRIRSTNALRFAGTGASDYKYSLLYNSSTDSMDWVYNG